MMKNNAEDKGMVIQDIFENIMLNGELDYEFLENFVCAYSYFILKTNKDYLYIGKDNSISQILVTKK